LSEQSQDMQRRLDEAAEWQTRLSQDADPALRADYRRWASEPRNARAAEAVGKGWNAVGALSTAPELLEMRQQALARVRRASAQRSSGRWWKAAAACLVLAMAGGGAILEFRLQPVDYETEIGGRRVVALPDGSHVSMDSDSAMQVRFTETERAITLTRGRARFDVAHDTSRPFTVTADHETVVAVGTSFDVEKLGSTVLVTLLQGQVVVKQDEGALPIRAIAKSKPSVSLTPGQQLVAAKHTMPTVASADLQVAAAWEAGHLVFHDEPLGVVVERVNRYTEHPVTVDPSAADIRISGVFNAGDVGSFVSAITGYFPIQATTTGSGKILLQHRV
jgi:transmembrane sensor